jgi:branched-chain amino acid aminotransferase
MVGLQKVRLPILCTAYYGYRAHMTSTLSFTRTPHPSPATPERVAEVLANPGFGQHFTDHMVTVRYDRTQGWHSATVEPYHPVTLDPAAMVLHYGQAIFEGLKAYRQPDGTIASFRPDANAERFRRSARRIAMPELPDELFLGSLRELIAVDGHWVPEQDEESLYLRPFMISTEVGLGVRPAAEYLYLLIASPAGSYFASGVKPVSVWLSTEYVRAAPGGTGAAKFAGNYAASLVAQAQAAEQGCDQVVWLDAVERRWVEEMGGMNLFFVFGSGPGARVVTPELSGSLLAGVTRDTLLTLATSLGYSVEERRISTEEWEKKAESGELTEVFACGTAAVITPVGSVRHADGEYKISGGATGMVTMRLRSALTAIQRGTAPDPNGWMVRLG